MPLAVEDNLLVVQPMFHAKCQDKELLLRVLRNTLLVVVLSVVMMMSKMKMFCSPLMISYPILHDTSSDGDEFM